MNKEHLVVMDEDDNEVVIPHSYVVCERCDGRGTHSHPAFDNGITASEWNGPDWDDESREMYMRGDYDATCPECHGQRVTMVPSDCATQEQRDLWQQHQDSEREYRSLERAEQRYLDRLEGE